MKIIDQGNFTGIALCILFLTGFIILYMALDLIENYYIRALFYSIGIATVGAAGYAARAKAFGLKPFGSDYKKIRDSYQEDSEEKINK